MSKKENQGKKIKKSHVIQQLQMDIVNTSVYMLPDFLKWVSKFKCRNRKGEE